MMQMLICQIVVNKADDYTFVVYGEDTDLLVLLPLCIRRLTDFFTFEKQTSMKDHRVWDISEAKSFLGIDSCRQLLFIHDLKGCDKPNRLSGIGKPAALKKIIIDIYLKCKEF